MATLLASADSEQDFLDSCRCSAASNTGDHLLKSRKSHVALPADDGDGALEGEGEAHINNWNIHCARMIIAFKRNIIRDLADEKLISYMIEFCEQPMVQERGCCYTDYAVTYPESSPAQQVLLLQMRRQLPNDSCLALVLF